MTAVAEPPPRHALEVVVPLPPADEVSVETGRIYATRDGDDLALDIYRPARPAPGPLPAVLLVHGEPLDDWPDPRSWGQNRSWGRLIAAAGLAAIVFRHRMVAKAGLDGAAEDVAEARRHVMEHADQLGIDPDRLALFGISFGVPFAAGAALRQPGVACLVCYYGDLDLRHHVGAAPAEALAAHSPQVALEGGAVPPPLFMVREGRDRPERNANIDAFVATALAANAPLTLVNLPRGTHGFDVLDDTPDTRDAVAATLAFLRTHLRAQLGRVAEMPPST